MINITEMIKKIPVNHYGGLKSKSEIEVRINSNMFFGIIRMWICTVLMVSVDEHSCHDRIQNTMISLYLPYWPLYILKYIPVPMSSVCRWYYPITYFYTYGMIIMINTDKNWHEVIWYVHNKMLYSH